MRIAVAIAVLLWMTPVLAGAQTALPRTPWGDPDLQGVWEHEERPAQAAPADPAEAAALMKARASRYAPGDRNAGRIGLSTEKPLVVDPADGRFPLLPGKFRLYNPAIRGDHWRHHFIGERCITKGVPDMYLRGDVHRIAQSPGWVVMVSEFIHDLRAIPVDGRPHVGEAIRQWNGDPRGRWDGSTLVVETTNFNDKGMVFSEIGGSIDQSDQMRVTERWTRVDRDTIRQRLTVDDPKVFSRPWTAETVHKLQPPGFFIVEYACHEGNMNYMTGSLRQGRVREQRASAAAKP